MYFTVIPHQKTTTVIKKRKTSVNQKINKTRNKTSVFGLPLGENLALYKNSCKGFEDRS